MLHVWRGRRRESLRAAYLVAAVVVMAACTGGSLGEIDNAGRSEPAGEGEQGPVLCAPEGETPTDLGDWASLTRGNVTVSAMEGSTAHRQLEAAHAAVVGASKVASELLETPYEGPLQVFLYENGDLLAESLGFVASPMPIYGIVSGTSVHEVCGGPSHGRPWVDMASSPHEIVHVITLAEWGHTDRDDPSLIFLAVPSLGFLGEGVAQYVSHPSAEAAIAALKDRAAGVLPVTSDWRHAVDVDREEWGSQTSLWAVATKYLIEERGGVRKYRKLWETTIETESLAEALLATYGLEPAELDAALRQMYGLLSPP